MKKKIIFVAKDGTEFPNESDCLEYEARLNMKKDKFRLNDRVNSMTKGEIHIPRQIDFGCTFRVIELNSDEDYVDFLNWAEIEAEHLEDCYVSESLECLVLNKRCQNMPDFPLKLVYFACGTFNEVYSYEEVESEFYKSSEQFRTKDFS